MQPFMALLSERSDLTARALQLLILTTARSRSIRYMQWEDIDLANEVWTVPREYFKRKQGSLTYPLSGLAEQILKSLPRFGPYVFPGQREANVMSENTVNQYLRKQSPEHLITVRKDGED